MPQFLKHARLELRISLINIFLSLKIQSCEASLQKDWGHIYATPLTTAPPGVLMWGIGLTSTLAYTVG